MRVEPILRGALWALLGVAALEALAAAALLTLATDEAWILMSARGIAAPPPAGLGVPATLTSGGLWVLVHGPLEWLAPGKLGAHRIVSWLSFAGTGVLLASWWRRRGGDRAQLPLLLAGLVAAPGSLVLAGLALAETLALLLLVAFAVFWEVSEPGSRRRWLGGSLLVGLLVATRTPALLVVPALLGWACLPGARRRERIRDAALVALGGSLVAAGLVGLHLLASGPEALPDPTRAAEVTGLATSLFDYPRLLNRVLLIERQLPLLELAGVSVAAWWALRGDPRRLAAPEGLLLVLAWITWAAWVLRTPIPNLRYLWPAIAGLWVVFGMALASLHRSSPGEAGRSLRLVTLAVAFAAAAGPVATTARHLVAGEANVVMWEWSGDTRVQSFRRFVAAAEQRDAARWLVENVRADEDVAVLEPPHIVRYLTGRRARRLRDWTEVDASVRRWKQGASLPRWLVLTPTIGTYLHLPPEGRVWLAEHATRVAEFGGHAIYRMDEGWPEDPALLRVWGHPSVRQPSGSPRPGYRGS